MRLLHQAPPNFISHTLPQLMWNHVIIPMHHRVQRCLWLQSTSPDALRLTECRPIHFAIDGMRLSSRGVAAELVELAILPLIVRVVASTPTRHTDGGASVTAKERISKRNSRSVDNSQIVPCHFDCEGLRIPWRYWTPGFINAYIHWYIRPVPKPECREIGSRYICLSIYILYQKGWA